MKFSWNAETKFFEPDGYLELTPEERQKITNGCGPKGAGYLVPDTFYGLKVTEV